MFRRPVNTRGSGEEGDGRFGIYTKGTELVLVNIRFASSNDRMSLCCRHKPGRKVADEKMLNDEAFNVSIVEASQPGLPSQRRTRENGRRHVVWDGPQ